MSSRGSRIISVASNHPTTPPESTPKLYRGLRRQDKRRSPDEDGGFPPPALRQEAGIAGNSPSPAATAAPRRRDTCGSVVRATGSIRRRLRSQVYPQHALGSPRRAAHLGKEIDVLLKLNLRCLPDQDIEAVPLSNLPPRKNIVLERTEFRREDVAKLKDFGRGDYNGLSAKTQLRNPGLRAHVDANERLRLYSIHLTDEP